MSTVTPAMRERATARRAEVRAYLEDLMTLCTCGAAKVAHEINAKGERIGCELMDETGRARQCRRFEVVS